MSPDGPRIIDFGIARVPRSSVLTALGTILGSPAYMSPEQVRAGTVEAASDVFSLGSLITFAATGHGAFDADAVHTIIYRIVNERPDLRGLPEALRPLVIACLSKVPSARPTVTAVLELCIDAGQHAPRR